MMLLLLALLLFIPRLALGAVAFDAVSSTGGIGVTSVTFSHTVSGSNTLLLCGPVTTTSISSATFNAVSMGASVGTVSQGGYSATLFSLAGAATGAHNVIISLGTSANIAAGCMSFNGVHQTTPLGTPVTDSGVVDTLSATITIPTNGAGASIGFESFLTGVHTSGNTERYDLENGDGSLAGYGSSTVSSGSVAMSWTLDAADSYAGILAVPINQTVAAPAARRKVGAMVFQ